MSGAAFFASACEYVNFLNSDKAIVVADAWAMSSTIQCQKAMQMCYWQWEHCRKTEEDAKRLSPPQVTPEQFQQAVQTWTAQAEQSYSKLPPSQLSHNFIKS